MSYTHASGADAGANLGSRLNADRDTMHKPLWRECYVRESILNGQEQAPAAAQQFLASITCGQEIRAWWSAGQPGPTWAGDLAGCGREQETLLV
jgi:hypothetical protein